MKKVLDACCGSRMFWLDKNDDRAHFNDIRKESHILCDGRELLGIIVGWLKNTAS